MNYLASSFRKLLRANRIYFIVFLASLLFQGFVIRANAQSSDKVMYYILYDISGSMPKQDSNENIPFLVDRMIKHDSGSQGKVEASFPFRVFFFGSETKNPASVSYDMYATTPNIKKQAENVSDGLAEERAKVKTQAFTHLNSALEAVAEEISKQPALSAGVFIFTDGLMKPGDIDAKEFKKDDEKLDDLATITAIYTRYLKRIDSTMTNLNQAQKPVFIVQSSPIREDGSNILNDYYSIDNIQFKPTGYSPDSLKVSSRFFWLNSVVSIKDKQNAGMLNYFDGFINSASSQITNPLLEKISNESGDEIPKDEFVPKVVLFNWFLFNFTYVKKSLFDKGPSMADKTVETLQVAQKMQVTDKSATLLEALVQLDNRLKSNHYERVEIEEIQKSYDELLKDPQIQILQDEIESYAKASNTLAATSSTPKSYNTPVGEELVSPVQSKQYENLEEAIVLGLADYLIERTKQEAFYVMYETVNQKLLEPIPFLKDTLFHHFYLLISDSTFRPDIVLLKEALQKDIDLLPQNLIIHPKIREKEGLLALAYSYKLVDRLVKKNKLEVAFDSVARYLPQQGQLITSFERGLLFTSEFIGFLSQHNLNTAYGELSNEELTRISKMAAIWFANKHPEILEVRNLNSLADRIKELYRNYDVIVQQIASIEKEFAALNPSGDFEAYAKYKRQLILDLLKHSSDLLLSGITFIEFFADESDLSNIKTKVSAYSRQAKSAVEGWFFIEDKQYAKAIALLLPYIPDITPEIRLESDLSRLKNVKANFDLTKFIKDCEILAEQSAALQAMVDDRFQYFDSRKAAQIHLTKYEAGFLEQLLLVYDFENCVYRIELPPGITFQMLNNASKEIATLFKEGKKHKAQELEDQQKKLASRTANRLKNGKKDKFQKPKKQYKAVLSDKRVIRWLFQYFDFSDLNSDLKQLIAAAGEVSTAKTAEDVKNALSKYALPVASYRIKRYEKNTWTINAYTGMGGSYFVQPDSNNLDAVLFAPIGLEYTPGSIKIGKYNRTSISFFGSLLDVGNVINYRLDNEDNKEERVFTIEKIVSPGAFISIGLFSKVPLSIVAGYQWNPDRVTAALTFDLPLFRIR